MVAAAEIRERFPAIFDDGGDRVQETGFRNIRKRRAVCQWGPIC
jgi:hypothetical protein